MDSSFREDGSNAVLNNASQNHGKGRLEREFRKLEEQAAYLRWFKPE